MNKNILKILLLIFLFFSCKISSKAGDITDNYLSKSVIDPKKFNNVSELQNQLHGISKNETPSVVFIGTEKFISQKNYNPFEFFFQDPFFGTEPFGQKPNVEPKEKKYKQNGLGSGVIYKRKGNIYFIVTNNHVIEGADSIKVTIDQKEFFKAEILGSDPVIDIGVLKIETNKELQLAKFGNSDENEVGDFVIAIGNPYGLMGSMSFGIISALGRSDIATDKGTLGNFIQTDAAINPGNSGGPLLNINGEVIGINTMIYSQTGGSVGIGFAIPVNSAKNVADQIIEKGKVSHGYLGVYFQELDQESIKTLGLTGVDNGMLVNNLFSDGPAEKAGIKTGDVLIELNGKILIKSSDLTLAIANASPGSKVTFKLMRDGKMLTKEVVLGNRDDMKTTEEKQSNNTKNNEKYGFSLSELTENLRKKYKIPNTINGVVVLNVQQGSKAESLDIKEGDVIFKINSKKVTNASDVDKLTDEKDANYFFIYRDGREFIVLM